MQYFKAKAVLLQSVPANIKARRWFQPDGALAHFREDVRSALDTAYPGRWFGRGGPPVDSDEALVARIAVVAGDIREMPGVFANVRQSLRRSSAPGGSTAKQFLRRSINRQVANRITENNANLALSSTFVYAFIESPI
ncbi:uncharacterized protein TNCV_1523691 [Trichonephila clavipes]|nr:uncharacterized protein TNCV_1523691 [Trichonephila clavipes]